ncbi:MAG: hypothetical protein ACI9O4_001053 [Chitinophagales bacterium]|jgi:hypothetical protein
MEFFERFPSKGKVLNLGGGQGYVLWKTLIEEFIQE